MTLANAQIGSSYIISKVNTDDEELDDFLFTLGCYEGQSITVVSIVSGSYVVSIRDGRYNIDKDLAEAIVID